VKVTAAASGEKSRLEGQGEADRTLAIGTANAQATKLSVDAYGGPEYRLAEQNFSRFADALTKINQPIVPQFLMSGAQGQENSGGLIPMAMLSSMFGRMMPDALNKLKEELHKGADAQETNLTALANSLNNSDAWPALDEEERKFKLAEEKKSLKAVIKVHSDEEYDAIVAEAKEKGKTVLVDCFATWCGPCVYISPIFSNLSEQFPNLVFVKIDVDEQKRTAESLNISAMPTFKVMKAGQVVDELVGADPEGLQALCNKHN